MVLDLCSYGFTWDGKNSKANLGEYYLAWGRSERGVPLLHLPAGGHRPVQLPGRRLVSAASVIHSQLLN